MAKHDLLYGAVACAAKRMAHSLAGEDDSSRWWRLFNAAGSEERRIVDEKGVSQEAIYEVADALKGLNGRALKALTDVYSPHH